MSDKVNRKVVSASVNQIRALTTADYNMVMHRQKIHQCCIVGNVLSINEQSTKTSYTITDYTAKEIEVVVWKNSEANSRSVNMPAPIMEQTYVRAYGQPRKSDEGLLFVAFCIQPLQSLNELTIHLLEVAAHAKDLLKLKNQLQCGNPAGSQAICGGGAIGGGGLHSGAPKVAGFSEIQSLVMNVIRQNSSDIGINLEEICGSVRTVKKETIKETIDFLLNEGEFIDSSMFVLSN